MNILCAELSPAAGRVKGDVVAWQALGAPPQEVKLDFCLPTGQSFRWRKTCDNEYTGVIGERLVRLYQSEDDILFRVLARGRAADPAEDVAVLRDYFNLDTRLCHLATGWAASCSRFREVSPHFPGARMLRQDPLECLFQFICSSNNHITRIHGMVERLCSMYGTPLEPTTVPVPAGAAATAAAAAPPHPVVPELEVSGSPSKAGNRAGKAAAAAGGGSDGSTAAGRGLSFYSFPTLEQLSRATEEELRSAGFGYRARFIVGATRALLSKPGGGRAWLLGLRDVTRGEAVEALTELPGIGPKVAACICLFSLDKHEAIPVDTHVWQIAVRYYCPQLAGKSLTKKVHAEVQQVFVERFGPYAGWAHNTLFISELASQQHRLPEHLRRSKKMAAAGGKRRGRGQQGKASGGKRNGNDEELDVNDESERRSEGDDSSSSGSAAGNPAGDADEGDGPDSRRGTSRRRHQCRKKGTAGAAVLPVEACAGSGDAESSGLMKAAVATVCTAMQNAPPELVDVPARGGGRRRESARHGRAVLELRPGPQKKLVKGDGSGDGGTETVPLKSQVPVVYGLEDFDDLVV